MAVRGGAGTGEVQEQLLTPSTLYDDVLLTPASTQDDRYPLASLDSSYSIQNRNRHGRWYQQLPYIIIAASVLEIVSFFITTSSLSISDDYYNYLVYDRERLCRQPWRYVTYMLLHSNAVHLSFNVVIQCVLAIGLFRQSNTRIISVYLGGVVIGALGSVQLQPSPQRMVGSSAGVYALLISHVPDIILNWEDLKYKMSRVLAVLVMTAFDIVHSVIHFYVDGNRSPQISWASHVCGALSGLLLGFVVYSSVIKHVIYIRIARYTSALAIIALLITFVSININMCVTNVV